MLYRPPACGEAGESRDLTVIGKIDYAGALAGVVFLFGITFAFIEAAALVWSSPSVLAMTLAAS